MEYPHSCRFFTKEFQKHHFFLQHEEPRVFGTAQCGKHQAAYIIYRVICAIWWISILLYDLIKGEKGLDWFIYLTNWSYGCLCISSILQLFCAVYHKACGHRVYYDEDGSMKVPLLFKIDWVVYTISCVAALIVTVVYWIALYGGDQSFLNIAVHGLNSAYVLIDIYITGVPIRILHFYFATIVGIVYGIFSVIYWASGGGIIYPILDWDVYPGQAAGLFIGLSFLGVPLVNMVLFCFYWLRVVIYYSICCSSVSWNTADTSSDLVEDSEIVTGTSNIIFVSEDA